MGKQLFPKDNLIIKAITGSHLYGTNTENSDMDFHGIFIPPKEYVYGLKRCEQVIVDEMMSISGKLVKVDYTCYSLPKYIHLATQNNPNIVSLLYTPRDRIAKVSPLGLKLLEAKSLFLSKKAYHTFKGYAHAQKRKIDGQRVGKRAEIVAKYGYDTKFAMHLMRLLNEALDILVEGRIIYPSPARQLLLSIRNGEKSRDWVIKEAERIEALVDEAYVRSQIQHAPDMDMIEALQMEFLEFFWNTNNRA